MEIDMKCKFKANYVSTIAKQRLKVYLKDLNDIYAKLNEAVAEFEKTSWFNQHCWSEKPNEYQWKYQLPICGINDKINLLDDLITVCDNKNLIDPIELTYKEMMILGIVEE